MNINKIFLAGCLTRDPELRFTPKGTAICQCGVAVNRRWTTESGEKKEEVTFVDVTFWGNTAEVVGKYFSKGNPIYLEGRLKLDSWEDKDTGQKRQKLSVVAESFQFVGGKASEDSESGQASSGQSKRGKSSAATKEQASGDSTEDDTDVPF